MGWKSASGCAQPAMCRLMLTAKEDVGSGRGIRCRADDYLVKPFSFDELLARIRALFRRITPSSRPEVLHFNDLSLDTGTHRAQRGERYIVLTAKEYELREWFRRNPRRFLTRELILTASGAATSAAKAASSRFVISAPENEEDSTSRLIHTVRGGLRAARRVISHQTLTFQCQSNQIMVLY
jgi:two-component system response regulator MprA